MADGEKKTIQINPEMFKVSGNTTRKNRAPRQSKNPIKVRAPPPPSKNNSTLKKNLLKMIRNHQQQQQQSHSQSKQSHSTPITPPISVAPRLESNTPKSEFEQSMQFLEKVNEKSQEKKEKKLRKPKNQTIRSVIPIGSVANRKKTAPSSVATPPPVPTPPLNPIAIMPPAIHMNSMPMPSLTEPPIIINPPKPYGCLKQGNLPTYRVWKNQTQKNLPPQTLPRPPKPMIDIPMSNSMNDYKTALEDKITNISKLEQQQILGKVQSKCAVKPRRKQKRIIKKTFRVGKSSKYPQVSVLVSNKTIRNNTNLKTIDLKQTPIKDVKQYLLKQGLIKVGTTTPIDVLRQMYESARLLPGEVKNYNPENLLYNYFNSDADL